MQSGYWSCLHQFAHLLDVVPLAVVGVEAIQEEQ
jgi:hypothetical protein